MKKSLVMAMVMAMGVTASAYAANPFSDVPAGHWAYDSIAQLAAAGIVEGYGATFGGDKLMTRYEMAQIVAKAMAKGANADKLAAEFADELDALGVRVAKLEKKVDNVKIAGQIRYNYSDTRGSVGRSNTNGLRSRIFVNGQINDNWSYTGMLQNYRFFARASDNVDAYGVNGSDSIKLTRAYLDGRIGGVKVRAGHWNEFFINDTVLDNMIDGVQASYGFYKGKINVFGVAAKFASDAYGKFIRGTEAPDEPGEGVETYGQEDNARLYILGVEGKIGEVKLGFNYFRNQGRFSETEAGETPDPEEITDFRRNIYSINADWSFLKHFGLTARYMWAENRAECNEPDEEDFPNGSKHGWFAQLNYKGADPQVPKSWGLRVRYFDQPKEVWLYPTYDCDIFEDFGGYQGFGFGASYTFAKNIMLDVDYYDTKAKVADADTGDKLKSRKIFSQLWFFF